MAEDFTDPDAKEMMLRIAAAYDELARREEGNIRTVLEKV
jgi:hypothetical protein